MKTKIIFLVVALCSTTCIFATATATKVTNASTLSAGDTIAITSLDGTKAMSTVQAGSYRGITDFDATNVGVEVEFVELVASNGNWKLKVADGFLSINDDTKNQLVTTTDSSTAQEWKFFVQDGAISLQAVTGNKRIICYNPGSTRFAAYKAADDKYMFYTSIYKISGSREEFVVEDKTIAEFISAEGVKCYLEGVVSNITDVEYGNFTLTDNSGSIIIYGCLTAQKEAQKFNTLGVIAGDTIRVLAQEYELYDGKNEAKNVTYISHKKKQGTSYASNVITYTANKKLEETSVPGIDGGFAGLYTKAFDVAISSHEFANGQGTITFSGEVTEIGNKAFYGCRGLTSVTIPNSVTSIGGEAFASCTGLTSVTIPNSVTSIGSMAFDGCSGLTSVTIGNGVTSIGSSAFRCCKSLTSVTIPNNVTFIGVHAFEYCSSLTSVILNSNLIDVLFEKSMLNGIFGDQVKTLVFGDSVTKIDNYAYYHGYGNKSLTSVTIGNSVTSIGDYAFYGCNGLTSVTIGNSVTKIGSSAFRCCESLTSVTIPNSVTKIGARAFCGCSGLTSVTFNGETTLDSEWLGDSSDENFYIDYRNIHFIVPCASTDFYKKQGRFTVSETFGDFPYDVDIAKSKGGTATIKDYNCVTHKVCFDVIPDEGYSFDYLEYSYKLNGLLIGGTLYDLYDTCVEILANAKIRPVFKNSTSVKNIAIKGLYAENGRIVCENAQDMRIYTVTGIDVTSQNGMLQGVYIVRVGEQAAKVAVSN